VLVVLVYGLLALGRASNASADEFCRNVTLTPYAKCYAWEWEAHPRLAIVGVDTNERAGCVTTAAQYSGDLKESWYCVGSNNFGWKYVTTTNEPRRGVIRSNNLSYSGRYTGTYTCCWS
jgi:hypothetical protein